MQRFIWRDLIGFGFALWLFGYILGIAFFALVPRAWIGWCVMPIGIAATAFTLWRWVKIPLERGAVVGVVWALIAVLCDYFAIVELFAPPDGYYKLDVYLYYLVTLLLPVAASLMPRAQPNGLTNIGRAAVHLLRPRRSATAASTLAPTAAVE